jgi:DNA-binding NtrC family response regulator
VLLGAYIQAVGPHQLLAEHFIRQYAPQGQVKLTDAALARLQQHPWPGNVRELRNVVCRALLVRKGMMQRLERQLIEKLEDWGLGQGDE